MNRPTKPSGTEVLEKAFAESAGKTVDVVIDQEIVGITPAMFFWWLDGKLMDNYTMWHPQQHVSARIDFLSSGPPVVTIEEYVGAYHTLFCCLATGHDLVLVNREGKRMGGIAHAVEPMPRGTKLRTTFTFPAKTPMSFIESMYGHSVYEMQDLSRFLPELYRQYKK